MTPDMPSVAAMLAARIRDLALALAGTEPTSRSGTEWRWGRKGSLAVHVAGPKRGGFHDNEAGVHGDALGLVAHLRRVPMRDAKAWALAWLGVSPDHPQPPRPGAPVASPQAPRGASASATADLARRIWREAGADDGQVARYLASRGLALPPDAPIRLHPDCPRGAERWPAMVALMTDPATGEPCGVHRTFLARDGGGKAPGPLPAKMMAGPAGVVRLVPDAEVTIGLGLAEGIETGLAVMQGFGWAPVWAATSAGAVRTFPVLPGVEALTVFADADGAGMAAAKACTARWAGAGREARTIAAPRGQDFNDVLRRRVAA